MSDAIGSMGKLVGQKLGQYHIIEPLGQGGMATVFKALQPSLQRYVAVKVLPPYYAHEPGFAQRFTREARAVAQLDHPHILPVHDYGQEGDYSYIVLKYVPAGTLKDKIHAGTLSVEQSVELACQIAEALDHAHQRGIIHRDVKPSNVLMDQGRWPLLTDFGLARMIEGSTQLTASGVGIGTPDYMAPEQGQGRTVDGRADIYSLGVVLFEMLTGQVPYDAETPMAVVLKHITEPLPLPRSIDPTIPQSIEGVILKALAKDPDDRYATAGEMAIALRVAVRSTLAPGGDGLDGPPVTPERAPTPTEAVPDGTEQSSPFERDIRPESAVTLEKTTPAPARQDITRRSVPWWMLAIGIASLLVLVGVVLWVTGVFRPFTADLESSALVQALPPPEGVVVDNLDAGFVIESGDWGTCDDGGCEGVPYGPDFRYADPGCTTCRARFDLRGADAGEYELWAWWPRGEDRATDTPFTIQDGNQSLTVRIDQRQNGSAWIRLATLSLNEDEPVRVRVEGTATGYANADAVALTPAGLWRPGTIARQDPTEGIIVDNDDPRFSIQAGEWEADEDDDAYGGEFLYAPPGCTSCRVRFDVTVTDIGEFDLWAWWPQGDDRATDTPFTVRHNSGSLTVNVDQRHNGTGWYLLATLSLEQGESVQVLVEGTETGYANADAVALTPAGSWTP